MDEEQDFIDKQLESIDLLLYKMRFYQDVYEKWCDINLGGYRMKITDEEREEITEWLNDNDYKSTTLMSIEKLLKSEQVAWEEVDRLRWALKATQHNIKNKQYISAEAIVDQAIDHIQGE